jgi:hypothetical protein
MDWRDSTLMPLGLDKIPEDRFFTQCLARLKPMQAMHEDEAVTVTPDKDWGRLPDLEHTFRNLAHSLRPKRRTTLYGHIDVRDRELFALHHDPGLH